MSKNRLEAFSDGVIAIIITIMVLELKVPDGYARADLQPLAALLVSYVLSFVFVGIYWCNHHHLFQAAHSINGRVLWANLHLLFWLSLTPFVMRWMGSSNFAAIPVALYGGVLLCAAIAYSLLTFTLVAHHGRDSLMATALGRDMKGKTSLIFYALAIPLAFASRWVACTLYVLVALMWLIPDPRFEKNLAQRTSEKGHP